MNSEEGEPASKVNCGQKETVSISVSLKLFCSQGLEGERELQRGIRSVPTQGVKPVALPGMVSYRKIVAWFTVLSIKQSRHQSWL